MTFNEVKDRLKRELIAGWSVWQSPENGRVWSRYNGVGVVGSIYIRDQGESTLVEAQSLSDTTWRDRAKDWFNRTLDKPKPKSR